MAVSPPNTKPHWKPTLRGRGFGIGTGKVPIRSGGDHSIKLARVRGGYGYIPDGSYAPKPFIKK